MNVGLALQPFESILNQQDKENRKLRNLIMHGLRLKQLPDMKKADVSQEEYELKYSEYLVRVHERKKREVSSNQLEPIHFLREHEQVITVINNATAARQLCTRHTAHQSGYHQRDKRSVILVFSLVDTVIINAGEIKQAHIRLVLFKNSNWSRRDKTNKRERIKIKAEHHLIHIKVFHLLENGYRLWLGGHKIDAAVNNTNANESIIHWLEFDVTKAVKDRLKNHQPNLGIEIRCNKCDRHGARIVEDFLGINREIQNSSLVIDNVMKATTSGYSFKRARANNAEKSNVTPVLNIVGHLRAQNRSRKTKSSAKHSNYTKIGNWKKKQQETTNCLKDDHRCCRHTMQVVFQDIKGFEFILQPKVFDAGFCRGRCPLHYKLAHHHAMLQSLLWKQNRTLVPRLCCTPSKLVELDVLHVDENNSTKLKISTWADIRVLECACS